MFITQRYPNQAEKAIFSLRFFGTQFLQNKSNKNKTNWVPKTFGEKVAFSTKLG